MEKMDNTYLTYFDLINSMNNDLISIKLDDINPYINSSKLLPFFIEPTYKIVSEDNIDKFLNGHLLPVIPRTFDINERLKRFSDGLYVAFSVNELNDYFTQYNDVLASYLKHVTSLNMYIDNVNGHYKNLYYLCDKIKNFFYSNPYNIEYRLHITVPNVFSLAVLADICSRMKYNKRGNCTVENRADFVVFNGAPNGTEETRRKSGIRSSPKIIGMVDDGSIKLAIRRLKNGASYCMVGSIFYNCIDICSEKYVKITNKYGERYKKVSYKEAEKLFKKGLPVYNKIEPVVKDLKCVYEYEYEFPLPTKYVRIESNIAEQIDMLTYWLKIAMFYNNRQTINTFVTA